MKNFLKKNNKQLNLQNLGLIRSSGVLQPNQFKYKEVALVQPGKNLFERAFSTKKQDIKLHPWFITGFIGTEGPFEIIRFLSFYNKRIGLASTKQDVACCQYSTKSPSTFVDAEIKYSNAEIDKVQILKENKNKCGVYRWVNLINKKSYVGSSVNLGRRIREYYKISHLEINIKKSSSMIYRALLKHGYSALRAA